MAVADAGSWNAGSNIGAALPHRYMRRSTFAERDTADTLFAEIDAHAFTQADAFSNPESHALPFDSVSLASHYMTFGVGSVISMRLSQFFFSYIKARHIVFF